MAAIRGADTKPEYIIRRGLHSRGFRYRLHDRKLPGRPDLVLPKFQAVIFVNGCFWHAHDCPLFQWPKTREDFWKAKIRGNAERDRKNAKSLIASGRRVATIWECALKGARKIPQIQVIDSLVEWIVSDKATLAIEGIEPINIDSTEQVVCQ